MIKVLAKVDAVFDVIASTQGISFTAVQKQLDINKATLSQILASMVDLGWLSRDRDGNYQIGEHLLDLARPRLGRESLRHALSEAVNQLATVTGEMASASILAGNRRIRIAKKTGHNEILVNDALEADNGSLWSLASGRLLLAFLNDAKATELLQHEEVSLESARTELARIKQDGLASMLSSNAQALSLARGVFSRKGALLAAIGITMPAYNLTQARNDAILADLAAAAELAEHMMQM